MSDAKILVVDDEPDHLAIVRRWLEDDGYEVVTAANGWDGLELLAEHRPDLTITDIARSAKIGRAAAYKIIDNFKKIGILKCTRTIGNSNFYILNKS